MVRMPPNELQILHDLRAKLPISQNEIMLEALRRFAENPVLSEASS